MSPRDTDPSRPHAPLDTRLRLDPNRIGDARWYLAEIDRAVFATAASHDSERHAERVRNAVAALFGS